MKTLICLLIPLVGSIIGSAFVYCVKKNINKNFEKIIIGISSGIILVASIWSLLIPSIDMSNSVIPAIFGLVIGFYIFIVIEKKSKSKQKYNTFIPMTIHNIPEGMSVGVIIAGSYISSSISFYTSLALCIGIAIQNIPDGLIVSIPLYNNGVNKNKAFMLGVLSGFVEFFSSIIALLFTQKVIVILPYILCFASSAMLYMLVTSLIPENSPNNKFSLSFLFGFLFMLILELYL